MAGVAALCGLDVILTTYVQAWASKLMQENRMPRLPSGVVPTSAKELGPYMRPVLEQVEGEIYTPERDAESEVTDPEMPALEPLVVPATQSARATLARLNAKLRRRGGRGKSPEKTR